MTELSKGANAPLETGPVNVAVAGARQGAVDLMAFQLAADRKVRSDNDFVFFNQPGSPEGAVRLIAADRIAVDLTAVPADVETLAVAVALDDAVAGSLADIAGLGVTVTGGQIHQAKAAGLTTERAAVLVEIYRRTGNWKVRNVSAGWAAGLSALADAHGVSIDDSPPPAQRTPVGQPNVPPPSMSPPNVPPSGFPPDTAQGVPAPSFPSPGGYPPPGGSLPPRPDIVSPRPGGWLPPGGPLLPSGGPPRRS